MNEIETEQCIINWNKNMTKIWDGINIFLGNSKQPLNITLLTYISNLGNTECTANGFATTFEQQILQIKHKCDDKWLN